MTKRVNHYFTLCVAENGEWCNQFTSEDYTEVKEHKADWEADGWTSQKLQILRTTDKTDDLSKSLAWLNHHEK
tara:strand:- start:1006 stop:1224 length:219 start_codon:yes stop_codon:yes gene_type:complete